MIKDLFASNVAKLVTACVCPVVGASAVALKVPPVRAALHKATAPEETPKRSARAKPRVRTPAKPATSEKPSTDGAPVQAALMCSQPMMPKADALLPARLDLPVASAPDMRISNPAPNFSPGGNCGTVNAGGGGGMLMRFAAVPEPATWAQMLAGFGLLGGTIRVGRRRTQPA